VANINQLRYVQTEAQRGIAGAVALTSVISPSAPGKTAFNVGYGQYHHASATALSMSHWFEFKNQNEAPKIIVSGGASLAESMTDSVFRFSVGMEF